MTSFDISFMIFSRCMQLEYDRNVIRFKQAYFPYINVLRNVKATSNNSMSKIRLAEDFSVDQNDVNDMSWRWYQVIVHIEYLSAKNCLAILDAIVNSYMRGRGFKMGNARGMEKHYSKTSTLMAMVIDDAIDKYEQLHRIKTAMLQESD